MYKFMYRQAFCKEGILTIMFTTVQIIIRTPRPPTQEPTKSSTPWILPMRPLLLFQLLDMVASHCAQHRLPAATQWIAQHRLPVANQRIGCAQCCAPPDEDDRGEWRVNRARLDAQWSQSVRKRRPRFLPFISARQWARAMYFTDEADWREWIDSGEKRNPCERLASLPALHSLWSCVCRRVHALALVSSCADVPRFPDEVYANSGWSGWDDFLNGPVEPGSVVFQKGYKRGKWLKGPLSEADSDEAVGR